MKHFYSTLFISALLSLFCVTASAYDIAVENEGVFLFYNYVNNNTELEVTYMDTGYNSYSGNVVIPEEVTYGEVTHKVTGIGRNAFRNSKSLTSVTIPNSVTGILESAFYNCSSLTSVTIPNSVTSIRELAFADCTGLTSITIPASVTSIGGGAFRGCASLISIVVEPGNRKYDSRNDCNAIIETATNTLLQGCNTTVIPTSVTTIGGRAFYNCNDLISIVVPNNVTAIEDGAFMGCTGLASITIPNSVTIIRKQTFEGCAGLTDVTVPNSVTSIEESAFDGCISLASIIIPNSVLNIGDAVFSDCKGLTSVTISDKVRKIGVSAFSGCTSLTDVTIPNSVTNIASQTFSGCTSLSSVTIPNSVTSIGSGAFTSCSSLTSVTIPNSVTIIGDDAFKGCTGFTSITIPGSVTKIGSNAFDEIGFISVVSEITEPFAIKGSYNSGRIFSRNTFYNATLYVPVGTIDAYKATDGWKDFSHIEEGSGVEVQKCATPTIAYNKGTLEFACETEGVEYVGEVNTHKQQQVNAATLTIQEPVTTITVFAKKDGYSNSDIATATISWQNGQPVFEGFCNVTIDSVYDLNGDGKISTADIQVIINEMKK